MQDFLKATLPADAQQATLVGRVWIEGQGPVLVKVQGDSLVDLSRLAPTSAQVELPQELDVAMRYVLDHYSDDIDLPSVARLCGLEPQAFSRFFKRQTGHTFARYVILARIYAACSLLTQTYRPITDICFEVGFNNVANFNRQFFKICGRTPSDYRRNAHKIGTEARADPFREIRAWSSGARAVGEKV